MSSSPATSPPRWSRLWSAVPAAGWLRTYRRRHLPGDLLAGVIVAALLVPQSLGYARIAGVPVQVGLYAVPLALLAYAVLGSSPQLIVGPASTVAIVSGSLVADIAPGDPAEAVAVTSGLAIATGVALLLLGLLRLGWLAEFLSKPIVTGFVFGLTLTIVVGELPSLLGIPKPPGNLLGVLVRTARSIDDAHLLTLGVGAAALAVLLGGGRVAPRVPWGLVTLVAGVVVSRITDLDERGVAVVGDVPAGLPPLGWPAVGQDQLTAIAVGGMSLALVALAEGLAAARLFATRGGYRVDTEHELIAMGGANVAAGLSGGLAVAGSLSKTAAAAQAGGRSQVAGVTSAGVVVVVLVSFTWFFTDLPRSVLSAIVVAAVWNLMDVPAMRRYYRVRRADFVAAVVGALGVVLFGPLPGLGIAIAVSLLAIIYRSSFPRLEVLGKIPGEKAAWGRLHGFPERRPVEGIVVVRLDAPLYWVNAAAIEERLLAELDRWPGTRALILDLEATTRLDTTSADVLAHFLAELRQRGVELYLARVLHTVNGVLVRAGFRQALGEDHFWHSISQCVRAARTTCGLKRPAPAPAADGGSDAGDVDTVDTDETDETDIHPGEERLAVGVDWVSALDHLDGGQSERAGEAERA